MEFMNWLKTLDIKIRGPYEKIMAILRLSIASLETLLISCPQDVIQDSF